MRDTLNAYHALVATEEQHPDRVRALLSLRKRLFVEHCGWSLTTIDDLERDEFDRPDTEHCLLFKGDALIGGFRAIRSDRPYLTATIFPELAVLRSFPRRRDVWEISRFGVLPSASRTAARLNYALMFRFAEIRGATALVAMADLAYERFLDRMNIRTRRLGPPCVIGMDTRGHILTAVAGEIPLDRQVNPGVSAFLDLANQLDIDDAAHVFGRSKIPA